ncbi:MAG: hypothetical protein OEV00_11615 [Acidobacteriota bacterium]|nr:hypothetical protein [Acidobacteriota bacterium]MDH3785960.1 hypothetical protein [Acidobacteriota bacterium]
MAEDGGTIELKQPPIAPGPHAPRTWLAILAAWVFPGLGHFLLGRKHQGLLFGLIVWSCFGLGLAHDGRLALRDSRQPLLTTMQVVANLGIGPADPIARTVVYGSPVYRMTGVTRAPDPPTAGTVFRERARSRHAQYGTAYLWTAGLMNLLLLFHVWDIARGKVP